MFKNLNKYEVWEVLSVRDSFIGEFGEIAFNTFIKHNKIYSDELLNEYDIVINEYTVIYKVIVGKLSEMGVFDNKLIFMQYVSMYKHPEILISFFEKTNHNEIIWNVIKPKIKLNKI